MKALFLRTDYYGSASVGGSFSHTRGFIHGLQKLGHECVAISSGPLGLPATVPFHEVPYSRFFRNLPEVLSIAHNDRVIRSGSAIIEEERPDFLYHRHSEFNYSSSVLSRRFRIPLILEFNGSEVWVKKNWGVLYLESILRMAEDVQLAGAGRIGVVSNAVKQGLVDSGVDPQKIFVNPNGVDVEKFAPSVDGSAVRQKFGLQGNLVAGFVGTFGAWHGVEVLARSVRRTVELVPEARFLIVGDGPLRAEVERILQEEKSRKFVTLAGSVPHGEIPQYLAACDVLLSPHVQNSDGTVFFGSPTKLFEYMGMGKAVVASAVGQIGEILADNVNCLLMREKDHEDLAHQISRLAADSSLRARLGERARRDAVEKYSWERNAQRVIDEVSPLVRKRTWN